MVEKLICSECGQGFTKPLSLGDYKYKVSAYSTSMLYQCSYTCNDHAILRVGKDQRGLTRYFELVQRCENMMRSQGKKVLHPIKRSPNSYLKYKR